MMQIHGVNCSLISLVAHLGCGFGFGRYSMVVRAPLVIALPCVHAFAFKALLVLVWSDLATG